MPEHCDLDVFFAGREPESGEVKESADEQEGDPAAHGEDLDSPA
jgi:hypothetical protein